jgi:hypothetical protein
MGQLRLGCAKGGGRPCSKSNFANESKVDFLFFVLRNVLKLFFAYRNEVALFYTKNRSESSTFLHHFIPLPWR